MEGIGHNSEKFDAHEQPKVGQEFEITTNGVRAKIELTKDLDNYGWDAVVRESSNKNVLKIDQRIRVHFGNRGTIVSVHTEL